MVHPLFITAAATAGIGAAVAFEVAVFRPWRDENWPNGFGRGVRDELLKLRREVEEAVTEIQDGFRTLRDDRLSTNRRANRLGRLSDDELDAFRRGVGEEASSESAQHEFEMHERQASAYRDRLRASMTENMLSGQDGHGQRLRRRRRPAGSGRGDGEASDMTRAVNVPVMDGQTPSSPELPHHSLGDASPSIGDAASLPPVSRFNSISRAANVNASEPSSDETAKSDVDIIVARNDLLGLDFGPKEVPNSACAPSDQRSETTNAADPFTTIVNGTASSWHAVFSNRSAEALNAATTAAARDSFHVCSSSNEDPMDESHVVLDTNGLSQTLSDQQESFHDLDADAHSTSSASDSPYQSNRALQPPSQNAPSTGTSSERPESEPDLEVLSDTTLSEDRWSHLQGPGSPTISSGGSEVDGMGRRIEVISDGEESWAELSDVGSNVGETRVRSI
ncbi:uncharacterized protein MEPE_05301 [Melanopsichium pennsylvanicum]|uniref:Uncharacterized protein n=2 Tax=Melanopsichium pennsylvanicum TaxID=63383 RepID=A0AAJ4XRL1_9BASI|nr:putative protein [Melanopsichium pennsylvanicum 4]SNX86592.1 uncharacterized protein MEPE_05301 [Melanopsichium pennsylvanicum]